LQQGRAQSNMPTIVVAYWNHLDTQQQEAAQPLVQA
jgi:hypothetical protein